MSFDPQSPSDRLDLEPDASPSAGLDRDIYSGALTCPECGEECDEANVECFETLDIICCDDCAAEHLEAHGQFGVGA